MGIRSPFDRDSSSSHIVDKMIGNAYPVVRKVYEHLDQIAYLANNTESILEAGTAAMAAFAEYSAPSMSSAIGHSNGAVGAQTISVGDRLKLLAVHPEEFGAADYWDGVSTLIDDTAAVQAALDTGRVVILRRMYRITDTLHSAGQSIEGAGYQTGFVFDTGVGKNGIEFAPVSYNTTSSCYNFAILKRGADGGSAIKTPYQALQYTQYRNAFQYEKLLIAGYTKPASGTNNAFETIETWLCGIEQGDAWNIGLREVDYYGSYRSDTDSAGQVKSVFIRLQAESAMLTAHLSGFTCSNVYRGVELGDRCFFQIANFDIAHAFDGVYQIGSNASFVGDGVLTTFTIPPDKYGATSPNPPPAASVRVVVDGETKKLTTEYTYSEGVVQMLVAPELDAQIRIVVGMPFGESKITHGNINAQHFGIYFQDVGTREISGVVIRRHKYGWKDAAYTWAGIRLVNCTYVWINNCQIQPDTGSGDWLTSPAYGVQLVKCGGVTALGTIVGNVGYGFAVSDTTMFTAEATQTFQANVGDVIFYLSENTRNSRIGSFTKVSTFKGTDYVKDETIGIASVQYPGQDVIPVSSTPRYLYRRPTSGADEKIWKTSSSAAAWLLQMTDDAETSNVNAIVVNRTGLVCTSIDMRTAQVKLANGPTITVGSVTPNANVSATVGSLYLHTLGAAATTLYVKESGTGNTGWVAK